MKVLLRDDVAGVGRRGDIVKVAGGFARNFLLPEGRAIVASEGIAGQAEQMRRGRDLREAQDRSAAEAQASILAGAVIPISARAGVRRTSLRLGRAGRRRRRHQGGQGRRGRPPSRRAAGRDQGDGHLRGDRRPVPRRARRHRRPSPRSVTHLQGRVPLARFPTGAPCRSGRAPCCGAADSEDRGCAVCPQSATVRLHGFIHCRFPQDSRLSVHSLCRSE